MALEKNGSSQTYIIKAEDLPPPHTHPHTVLNKSYAFNSCQKPVLLLRIFCF